MRDSFTKLVLTGILICLAIIAFKPTEKYVVSPTPNVNVESKSRFVQVAPNIIGVMDTGHNSGKEQLVIFEYDVGQKSFEAVSTLEYQDIFTHPERYGIPVRK